jgi:hypothetical protein
MARVLLPVPVALLSDGWRDIVSVVSLVCTVLGLWWAIAQIRQAKTAAEAAREAADEALRESQKSYHKHAAGAGHRLLNQAIIYIDLDIWLTAGALLGLLAEQVALLIADDESWVDFAAEVRKWEERAKRQAKVGPSGRSEFSKRNWNGFKRSLQAKIDEWSGPFAGGGGV